MCSQVNGASISSESNSSEDDSNEDYRTPYSRVRPKFQKKLEKIVADIQKDVRKQEEHIAKETAEQIADFQEDLVDAQQKLDKNLRKSRNDLYRLASFHCIVDSKLVKLSDKLDACFEGSENKVQANSDQGLRQLSVLSYRYSPIKYFLGDCDHIRNDQAAKKCAEGKVSYKICSI